MEYGVGRNPDEKWEAADAKVGLGYSRRVYRNGRAHSGSAARDRHRCPCHQDRRIGLDTGVLQGSDELRRDHLVVPGCVTSAHYVWVEERMEWKPLEKHGNGSSIG